MSGLESDTQNKILDVVRLAKYYPIAKGFLQRVVGHVRAVDDVSLHVDAGETLAIVGESGSGKTTLGRVIVRATDATRGEVLMRTDSAAWTDLSKLEGEELKAARKHFHMIFQDPYSSLDPRMTVFNIISEPLVYNQRASAAEAKEKVIDVLRLVGLSERQLTYYPHAFSGGQRQRIGIARSLICRPKLIVCDEAVSALDVSVQAQILNLLKDLQAQFGLSYVFIAHDMAVVEFIAHRISVMYVGKMVELAATSELFSRPRHPYTEALLSAVPIPEPNRARSRIILEGEVANPANPPSGCYFHPRCRYADERCRRESPQWREISSKHFVACHHSESIELKGMA